MDHELFLFSPHCPISIILIQVDCCFFTPHCSQLHWSLSFWVLSGVCILWWISWGYWHEALSWLLTRKQVGLHAGECSITLKGFSPSCRRFSYHPQDLWSLVLPASYHFLVFLHASAFFRKYTKQQAFNISTLRLFCLPSLLLILTDPQPSVNSCGLLVFCREAPGCRQTSENAEKMLDC